MISSPRVGDTIVLIDRLHTVTAVAPPWVRLQTPGGGSLSIKTHHINPGPAIRP